MMCGYYPFADDDARTLRKKVLKAPVDALLSRAPWTTTMRAPHGAPTSKKLQQTRSPHHTRQSPEHAAGGKEEHKDISHTTSASGTRSENTDAHPVATAASLARAMLERDRALRLDAARLLAHPWLGGASYEPEASYQETTQVDTAGAQPRGTGNEPMAEVPDRARLYSTDESETSSALSPKHNRGKVVSEVV